MRLHHCATETATETAIETAKQFFSKDVKIKGLILKLKWVLMTSTKRGHVID